MRLSVEEQLARRRAHAAHLMDITYGPEEIVNAYARAFYAAIDPSLSADHAELVEARAAGIHSRQVALLYSVSFEDIEPAFYRWLENHAEAAISLADKIPGIPSLTHSPERKTAYEKDHTRHARKVTLAIKNQRLHPAAAGRVLTVIEFAYTLIEVFNHAHELSTREQEHMPANLALLAEEAKVELAHFHLPQLAVGTSHSDVYFQASKQHTAQLRYPKSLWQADLDLI